MSDSYLIHNQQKNLLLWALMMRRNLLRIAPVCPTLPTSLTLRQVKNSSTTLSNTNIGHHSKWCQHVWKLRQHAILHDKSCATGASASKSSASVTLTQRRISTLYNEMPVDKTSKIDKIV